MPRFGPLELSASFKAAGFISFGALSKEQQACVSRKIKKLADEGYTDEKQRIAIAIKHCAPDKAYGVKFDSLDPPSNFAPERQPDGSVIIRDVPTFAETPERRAPDGSVYAPAIGYPWLRRAFEKHEQKTGYWAPLHGDHHSASMLGGEKDRPRFGEFRPSSLRLMRVDGELKWVWCSDWRFDSEDLAREANRLPYQSVEIVREKPDEINSVALLGDKAPFIRFPNRRIDFATGHRIAYSADASGGGSYAWRSFMAEPGLNEDPAEAKKQQTEAKKEDGEPLAAEKKQGEGSMGHEAYDDKPEARINRIEKDMADMKAGMSKLMEAMSMKAKAGYEAKDEPESAEEETAEDKKTVAPVVAASAQDLVGLKTEVLDLKSKLAEMETNKLAADRFASFKAQVEPTHGWTEGQASELVGYIADDLKFGSKLADKWLKIELSKPRISRVAKGPAEVAAVKVAAGEPAEMAQFAAMGEPAYRWAQSKLAEYRSLERVGGVGKNDNVGAMSFASFLHYQSDRPMPVAGGQ